MGIENVRDRDSVVCYGPGTSCYTVNGKTGEVKEHGVIGHPATSSVIETLDTYVPYLDLLDAARQILRRRGWPVVHAGH